jgi:O-antigen ligase
MTTIAASRLAWPVAAAAGALVLGAGLALAPLITAGAFLGVALFLLTLARPLVVLGLMLAIGAVDLSFITGGAVLEGWGGIDMNGMRLIGMVIALGAIMMVEPRAARHAFSPRARWYGLFLIYGAVTLAFSILPLDGARLLLKLAYPLLLFVAVLAVVRERRDLERLMDWALVGGALTAVVVVPLLFLLGQYEFDVFGRLLATGAALNGSVLSFYMLMMALMAFGRFAVRRQAVYLLVAAVCGAWIVLSMTRITLLATIVAFGAIAAYSAWRDRDIRLPLIAAAVMLLVVVPLTPIALERTFGVTPTMTELASLAADPATLYNRMNLQGREVVWPVVGQAFLSSPVFGQGLGVSNHYVAITIDPAGGAVVHNEYLRLAADTGLIGIVLFTTAMMIWLMIAIRGGRGPGLVREFAVPAGAGMVAWAVIAITDNPFDYYAQFTQYIAFLVAGTVALTAGELGGELGGADIGAGGEVAGGDLEVGADAVEAEPA